MATIPPVLTQDGHQPIFDENGPWRMWGIDDVYFGINGKNRYVPKVNDYVIRPLTYETWIVKSVDPVTLIPKLEAIRPYGMSTEMTESDILFGVGPGTQAQLLRVYINKANYPYRMTVDTHCFVGGASMAYAVIYKNGIPETGGEPVSKMYNNNGEFIGVEVPLEIVALDSHGNRSIKIVSECKCNEEIEDGTPLYVVFYSADGVPRSKATLLAENTSYIRGLDIQEKFVVSIGLESPWLSSADSNVLKFPLNIPKDALDLVGVVNYNVGPPLRLPVDGTRFQMAGLDGYVSSIPGEQFDLALIYNLSANEKSFGGQGVYVDRKVTAPYKVVTQVIEPGYTVKLFMYPFWNGATKSYKLRYWLYNLARNSREEVTDLVTYSVEQGAFDPKLFGNKQRLQVNLNLRKVSASFKPMIHTQMFDVTLFGPPGDTTTPWIIKTELGVGSQLPTAQPGFGRDVYVTRVGTTQFTVKANCKTKQEWLQAFYLNTDPLIDRGSEVYAPVPTHFQISFDNGTSWMEFFIDTSWDKVLTTNRTMTLFDNAIIRFTKPLGTGTSEVGICAATIRQ